MSFWRTFGFHTISAVETILDRESYTLEELLDEEEILQEVKSQNKKLLDFIIEPATLLKLFEYITKDPPEDADPKRRFKYPFLACEILSSEIWQITEAVFRDETLLEVLFSFLDREGSLNPLLASYTSRVAIVLLSRRTAEVLGYIKKKENIIPKFIVHLGSASIMELLLKVIGSEETAEGVGIIQWLCGTELVSSLLGKFEPGLEEEIHENAGQTLADIISVSAHIPTSPLLAQLESEQFVSQLFKYILSGSNSVLLNGLGVVIELLKRHAKDATDDVTTLETLPPLISTSVSYLEQFDAFLKKPYMDSIQTTVGTLSPLGFYRLKVIDFYLAVLRTRYRCVDEVLVKLGIINTSLDLFFAYPWNNFLHASVEQIIHSILESNNDDLRVALLGHCKLLDRIVEASKLNISESVKPKAARLGYMGFVTAISFTIANASTGNARLEELLDHHSEWKTYASTLTEIRTIENKPLGGHRPLVPVNDQNVEEEEEQHDPESIFDRYKLGFTEDFPEDANEYDDGDMTFDTTGGFGTRDYSTDKNFELYEDDNNENLGDVDSDDSDDDEHDDEDLWVEKKVTDVGGSPSEENAFPTNEEDDSFGDFVKEEEVEESTPNHHPHTTAGNAEGMATESS